MAQAGSAWQGVRFRLRLVENLIGGWDQRWGKNGVDQGWEKSSICDTEMLSGSWDWVDIPQYG